MVKEPKKMRLKKRMSRFNGVCPYCKKRSDWEADGVNLRMIDVQISRWLICKNCDKRVQLFSECKWVMEE
jgi:transposase-like protein